MQPRHAILRLVVFICIALGFMILGRTSIYRVTAQTDPTPNVANLYLPLIGNAPTAVPTITPTPIATPCHESESNNQSRDADGPVVPQQGCNGMYNDQRDYYYFDVQQSGQIIIDLNTSHQDGVQLQLFRNSTDVDNRIAFVPYAPYHINYTGNPERYYIFIYTTLEKMDNGEYMLNVSYPVPPTPIPTFTPTPTLVPNPDWPRMGQSGLNINSLAIQAAVLFAGDRRSSGDQSGLYVRSLDNCVSTDEFFRLDSVQGSVLDVTFQAKNGLAATYDYPISYTSDNGNSWQQTTSNVGRPRTVAFLNTGIAYAGAESEGLYQSSDRGATWAIVTTQPGAINRIRAVQDTLWIGTYGEGVWQISSGNAQPKPKNDGLDAGESYNVWDFAFHRSGTSFVATGDGVYRDVGVGWQRFGLDGIMIRSLEVVSDTLYAGTINYDQGQFAQVWGRNLDSSDWTDVSVRAWNIVYAVRDLLYAPTCDGLLVGTDDGVWLYRLP